MMDDNYRHTECGTIRYSTNLAKWESAHYDSSECWCDPELEYEDPDTGAQVWVHREIH